MIITRDNFDTQPVNNPLGPKTCFCCVLIRKNHRSEVNISIFFVKHAISRCEKIKKTSKKRPKYFLKWHFYSCLACFKTIRDVFVQTIKLPRFKRMFKYDVETRFTNLKPLKITGCFVIVCVRCQPFLTSKTRTNIVRKSKVFTKRSATFFWDIRSLNPVLLLKVRALTTQILFLYAYRCFSKSRYFCVVFGWFSQNSRTYEKTEKGFVCWFL